LKKLEWNILPTESVLPSTRCTKEEQLVLNNIYKEKMKWYTKKKETI